jgi:hypothetical protein
MKTPEELAEEWIETSGWNEEPFRDEYVIEFKKEGYVAGYKAAQEHAHAALEEAEARIQELQDQLADADKVINSSNNSNGWISVKDRLPELWNDYLAFGYGPTIPASCFVAVYDPKSNKWYDMHTDWDWSDVITHWQELPEPPKEEK